VASLAGKSKFPRKTSKFPTRVTGVVVRSAGMSYYNFLLADLALRIIVPEKVPEFMRTFVALEMAPHPGDPSRLFLRCAYIIRDEGNIAGRLNHGMVVARHVFAALAKVCAIVIEI
jgi:hypothetical protein